MQEVTFEQMAALFNEADNIIITGHINPDGDCLGSMLALYHYLSMPGKRVEMRLDDDIPKTFGFLPGIDKIERYSGDDIVVADLLVVLDASDLERTGKIGAQVRAPILNIDHHISNNKFADYYYIDANAAATGEIIFALLEAMGVNITTDIALCLYTAIATDSGFFRYANTTSSTMRLAADLIDKGVRPNEVSEHVETKSLSDITLLTKVLQTLELFEKGKIAVITVMADTDKGDGTDGLINYPRSIEGVEVAVMLKFYDESMCKVSFRSKNIDVSKLAVEFGGGGHVRAAGCTISGTFEDVKRRVVDAVIRALQESKI